MYRRDVTAGLFASAITAVAADPAEDVLPRAVPWYPQTAEEAAAGVTASSPQYLPGDVRRYGAKGDGASDDTSAIRRAVRVAEVAGGTVYFPAGHRFTITAQVTVSSRYPVNLVGEMGMCPNPGMTASYIRPGGNIDGAMLRYASPTDNPTHGGGGLIRGLSFLDDSNLGATSLLARRVYQMSAAIDLDSFSCSTIENCQFHWLNGSALLLGFCIMSNFDNLTIRYCGARNKAAIQMRDAHGYQSQSCVFSALRSEVNFSAPHVLFASNSNDNKIIAAGFESNQTSDETANYITFRGLRNAALGCHFNRRTAAGYAVEFATGAGRCSVLGAACDLGDGRAYLFSGDRNEVLGGYVVAASSTSPPVAFSGVYNRLENVHFYYCNGFSITRPGTTVAGCTFDAILDRTGYCLSQTPGGSAATILGNRFVNLSSGTNGISLNADGICEGNHLKGGGGGSVGIRVNADNLIVVGNHVAQFDTQVAPGESLAATTLIEDNIGFLRRNSGAATNVADGGRITHGLSGTPTHVTVTASVAGSILAVTAIGPTAFTVGIRDATGRASPSQTVYWHAEL
jgi:hypothetical protein